MLAVDERLVGQPDRIELAGDGLAGRAVGRVPNEDAATKAVLASAHHLGRALGELHERVQAILPNREVEDVPGGGRGSAVEWAKARVVVVDRGRSGARTKRGDALAEGVARQREGAVGVALPLAHVGDVNPRGAGLWVVPGEPDVLPDTCRSGRKPNEQRGAEERLGGTGCLSERVRVETGQRLGRASHGRGRVSSALELVPASALRSHRRRPLGLAPDPYAPVAMGHARP